jgi:hypothetical protein
MLYYKLWHMVSTSTTLLIFHIVCASDVFYFTHAAIMHLHLLSKKKTSPGALHGHGCAGSSYALSHIQGKRRKDSC